jgi:hypothetical protein
MCIYKRVVEVEEVRICRRDGAGKGEEGLK